MIILGVDPGSLRTGYGAVDTDGRRYALLEKGVLVPPRQGELAARLRYIHDGVASLIRRLHPDALAVEDVFHAVNSRSALVLGHVRGIVLLAGAEAGLAIHEFPPATVKMQVTGFGRAEKAQVALMVSRILGMSPDAEAGDAADALAVALCLAQRHGSPLADLLAGAGARRRR